ncbi:MAG: hypothetical protein AAGI07_13315 [Bacteroidota bacterium]
MSKIVYFQYYLYTVNLKGMGGQRKKKVVKKLSLDKVISSLSPEEKKIRILQKELQEVKLERDILKKAGVARSRHLLQRRWEKYEFIAENYMAFPI